MPLWLLSALGWVKTAFTALIDLARRYPMQAALIASLCLNVWLWRGWDKAEARYANFVAKAEKASKEARAKQIALNQAMQAKYETLAEKADHAHAIELADARSRAAAYANRNGVRSYCQGSAGQTSSPAEGPVAPRDNGPGADAVILNRDDFDQLVENTLRLKAAHEWGESLVRDGVAVVYPEPKLSGD